MRRKTNKQTKTTEPPNYTDIMHFYYFRDKAAVKSLLPDTKRPEILLGKCNSDSISVIPVFTYIH